jgi:hypothetical protein
MQDLTPICFLSFPIPPFDLLTRQSKALPIPLCPSCGKAHSRPFSPGAAGSLDPLTFSSFDPRSPRSRKAPLRLLCFAEALFPREALLRLSPLTFPPKKYIVISFVVNVFKVSDTHFQKNYLNTVSPASHPEK